MVGKKKDAAEKSTNEFTQRVERRRKDMSDHELKIDNAKRADAAAVTYAVKKLKGLKEFKELSVVEQVERVKAKKDEVIFKR